jgi:hypothetical protein
MSPHSYTHPLGTKGMRLQLGGAGSQVGVLLPLSGSARVNIRRGSRTP